MNPYKILIVEDEAIVAMDIEDRLAGMGYQLAGRAASAEQALALVAEQHPHLVLMDIRLRGDMDGIAAAEELRRRFHLPVIFLTAYSEDETLARAKLTEPFGYILKPFNDRELKSTIEIALYKHQAEEEIRHLNRLYDVLSQVNQTIVRVCTREELLATICCLMMERGKIDLAWIGWLDPATAQITPVAHCGIGSEILDRVSFYADDRPEGSDNPGQAIRAGQPVICNHCPADVCLYPAALTPARFGFQSCASFPLRFQGQVCGALNLFVSEPEFFQDREIALLQEVAQDISFALDKIEADAQRERLTEQLQSQSAFLRTLLDAMPFPIFYKDAELRYLGCNTAFEQFFGVQRDQIVHKTVFKVWPEEVAKVYHRTDQELLADLQPQVYEVTLPAAGVAFIDVLAHKAVFRNPDGSVGGIIGAFEEITERKQAEAAIQERLRLEERLSRLAATVPGIIYAFRMRPDGSYYFPYASPKIAEIFGLSPEELSADAAPAFRLIHPDDIQHIRESILESARSLSPWQEEFRVRHPQRGEIWIEGRSVPGREPDGETLWHGFIHDITARKQAEAERALFEARLRQAQKMEALGTQAGGIAHDFNNILGVIIGYTEMADLKMEEGNPIRKNLQEVLKASQRAKELVQQILAFSRRSEQEKKPMAVRLIVQEAMKMLRASLPSTIDIKVGVSSRGVILADPTQIHQVLMNLCTNAAHSMQENGGVLQVSITDVQLGPEALPPASGLQPGPHVQLMVQDTGQGIPPALLDRIFDPFFTTKEPGVGTGLGLAVVHGIVKSHGGAIEVESIPGQGTTFRVFLPALESAPEVEKPEVASLPRGRERILIVDDEPALALAAKQMLELLGYEADYRTSASEALQIFQLRLQEKPFDLVVTDMTMPHLTGLDFARELLQLQPDLPILLCTGFSDKIDAEMAQSLGIKEFLLKPIGVRELAQTVRKVLDEKKKSL